MAEKDVWPRGSGSVRQNGYSNTVQTSCHHQHVWAVPGLEQARSDGGTAVSVRGNSVRCTLTGDTG